MARPDRLAIPRDRRSLTLVVLATVVLVLLGIVAVRLVAPPARPSGREMRHLEVGDCLKIVPRPDRGRGAAGGMNIAHQEVPCQTPGVVTYVVASIAEGPVTCPNPNYQEYWEADESGKEGERGWAACLMPNLVRGVCYEPDSQTKAFAVSACGPNSLFRVETVADVDDIGNCTASAEPFNFPTPARTYCVTALT